MGIVHGSGMGKKEQTLDSGIFGRPSERSPCVQGTTNGSPCLDGRVHAECGE